MMHKEISLKLLLVAVTISLVTNVYGRLSPLHLTLNGTYAEEDGEELRKIINQNYSKDFNFHNKTLFLKETVYQLVECIEKGLERNPGKPLPHAWTLNLENRTYHPNETLPDLWFVFRYNGSRGYGDSCLGDAYKRDFIRRLYDGSCINYTEKIQFLDLLSCNASQNLECRQTGVEPESTREWAEQATPIFKCVCPDYNSGKPQSYIKDGKIGYFCPIEKRCALRFGQKCEFVLRGFDQRLLDQDFEVDTNKDGLREGIWVTDMRPLPETYPCVGNAFCYVQNDSHGLNVEDYLIGRCVCGPNHYPNDEGECIKDLQDLHIPGIVLSLVFTFSGFVVFLFGMSPALLQ